jgi:tetratricopeptide (TPR) repeat protein
LLIGNGKHDSRERTVVCSLFFVLSACFSLTGCLGGGVPSGETGTGPADPDSLVSSGRAAAEAGDYAAAKLLYTEALNLEPDYAPALRGQADLAGDTNDPASAIHYLELLVNLPDATPDDHAHMADALVAAGRKREALDHLELAVTRQPDSALLVSKTGLLLLDTGSTEDALPWLRRAVAMGGVSTKAAHRALGRVLFDSNRTVEAAETLELFDQRYPGDFKTNMLLAYIHFNNGDYEDALPRYRVAVETNPGSIDARVGLARTLEQLGRTDNAIRVYDEAIEIRGLVREMEPVILAQADLLNQRGKYRRALDLLDETRNAFPETPGLACARGMALAGEGRYDEAITAFGRASTDSMWSEFANQQIHRIRNLQSSN